MAGRRAVMSAGLIAITATLVTGALRANLEAAPPQSVQAPTFEVDLMWPKPMPNHWLLGSVVGVAVDSRDHVFVTHLTNSFNARTETGADPTATSAAIGECCRSAPAVLEFDPEGNVVNSWGGPGAGYTWPASNHGLAIDPDGNIWIGGSGGTDSHILKFTRDGKFIAQIGKAGAPPAPVPVAAVDTAYTGVSNAARGGGRGDSAAAGAGRAGGGRGGGGRGGRGGGGAPPALPPNSASVESFGGPADFSFDAATGEAFVADGYRNRRVAVVDYKTGAIKRFWGASGNAPVDGGSPTAAQFGTPVRCAEVSRDGLVYVCDRANNRIQVFDKAGKFVREATVAPATRGEGSVWDVTFSRDPQQRYLYVADGANMKVHVLDRTTLRELTSFGEGGRLAGQFYAVHSIATDSKGNVYTVETYQGKRLQKFNFKGVRAVTKPMGAAWPGKSQ